MTNNKLMNISENEMMQMIDDTGKLVVKNSADHLSSAAAAAHGSNALSNNVEFWKWLNRNYGNSGIFESGASMQQYIAQGKGKEEWLIKQLQGKGFEWDWMKTQRNDIRNIFKTYDAGDVANKAAIDVTEKNILTGANKYYQMKAYTSKTNPDLKTTPKDVTVVTNAEKVDVVKGNGYESVQEFQDAQKIKEATKERFDQIKDGKAYTSYNVKNVAGTMAKAGLIGCVAGIGTEAIASYKSWKSGQLTDEEYLKEIMKSGGDAGVTAGVSAGIMMPVSAAITAAGASTLITIPVAFVISGAVNKIVAPCFGRGKYKEILMNAKYYQNLEDIYDDLIGSMQNAAEEYYGFVSHMSQQKINHEIMKKRSMEMNKELSSLYDSI